MLRQRLRRATAWLGRALHTHYWFPHVPMTALLAVCALGLLRTELGLDWQHYLAQLAQGQFDLHPGVLPALVIGLGQLIMVPGLLARSRLAWVIVVMLAVAAMVSLVFGPHHAHGLLVLYGAWLAMLIVAARRFDHSSLAASTLGAFTAMLMLTMYGTFGSYYLGAEFSPPITDLVTAFYYALITMTTVGYGDITPHTPQARLFAISVVVFGVTVFATSLTAIIGPLVRQSLQRIVNRREPTMKRENHFIVVGNTPLADNTWRELSRRDQPVTRLLAVSPGEGELDEGVDLVVGDPSDVAVLRQAGADKAQAVLAMLDDDSDNAFTVLAVKELGGKARTVAAVNETQHLARVKLVQPDVVIAPQVLGGELTAMLLTGEQVTGDFVLARVFQ